MKEVIKSIPIVSDVARHIKNLPKNIKASYQKNQDVKRIRALTSRSPLRIVVGSAGVFDDGWIGTEQEFLDLTCSKDWAQLFSKDSIDAILAEHVWEHLTLEDGLKAASLCHDYLKPGGYFRIAVPDGNHPSSDYIESVKIGGHGEGAYDHKVLFTIESLSSLLEKAGFEVKPLEYFDTKGEFHFNSWDPAKGMIYRTSKNDERNENGKLNFTSLVVDAVKK